MFDKLTGLIAKAAGGTIFSVHFIKRTTGQPRTMVCKLEGLNPHAGGLLLVRDMHKNAIRSVPLESIEWIKIRGKVYLA